MLQDISSGDGGGQRREFRHEADHIPKPEVFEVRIPQFLKIVRSLKERVTRPSASVSRPIDVAVISKNDGFIWIKRKHYFDPKLNPRFFAKRTPTGSA